MEAEKKLKLVVILTTKVDDYNNQNIWEKSNEIHPDLSKLDVSDIAYLLHLPLAAVSEQPHDRL